MFISRIEAALLNADPSKKLVYRKKVVPTQRRESFRMEFSKDVKTYAAINMNVVNERQLYNRINILLRK